jgi:hypothetical protein
VCAGKIDSDFSVTYFLCLMHSDSSNENRDVPGRLEDHEYEKNPTF